MTETARLKKGKQDRKDPFPISAREVVIVLSTPRSGSTLIGHMLGEHSKLDVLKDDTAFLYLLYFAKTLNPFADDRVPKLSPNGWVDKLRSRLVSNYFINKSDSEKVLTLVSPTYIQFFPLLAHAFPNAKFVHLKRNPYDAIASFSTFLAQRGSGIEQFVFLRKIGFGFRVIARRLLAHLYHSWRWVLFPHSGYLGVRPQGFRKAAKLSKLEFLSWYFCKTESQIQQAFTQISSEQQHVISYEDLVQDFENVIQGLLSFIDVDADPAFIKNNLAKLRDSSIKRHKRDFSDEQRGMISEYLQRYKYAKS